MLKLQSENEPLCNGTELTEVKTDKPYRTTTENGFATLKKHIIGNNVNKKKLNLNLLNAFDTIHLQKPILLHACEGKGRFKEVKPETIQFLIDRGATVDYVDKEWYGWEALHYAAAASDPEKLQVICRNLGSNRINTLTMLSENALHILLEHSILSESFTLSCQNGEKVKMSKIINKEHKQIVECAEVLIKAKIDVNHPNFWNETPLIVAIKHKYFGVVSVLLKAKDIDIDACKDMISGKTIRELLKPYDNLVLPNHSSKRSPNQTLFHFLKSGDEENFFKFNGGKICDFVDSIDGDVEQNSSCTLLQYCFRRGLIFWHQDKQHYESDLLFPYQDITANRVVQVFCESSMIKCIQHLLDNGADVDFSLRKFENGKSVLEAAIMKGFYPFVSLILGRREFVLNESKIPLVLDALIELLRIDTNSTDINNTLSIVLNKLIETDYSLEGTIEQKLMIILKDGVKKMNKENLLLLLKFPSSLCWNIETKRQGQFFCKRNFANPVLEQVDPEILKEHLNDCVEQDGDRVNINCHSFLRNDSMHLIFASFMASNVLRELLNHSVFKILIMRHWEYQRVRWPWCKIKYFYLNFFFYLSFYVILHMYILYKFNGVALTRPCFFSTGLICLMIFVCKELFQLLGDVVQYFQQPSNWLEFIFIICASLVICLDTEYVDIFEVLAILSANSVLILFLLKVPAFSKYMIILGTILFYLRYLFFYFIQFLAFAICFYILFSKSDQVFYIDIPNKLFDTIILFTGNLDYMETPWRADNSTTSLYHNFTGKELFSKLVFITFVLFLSIILQNLLLGLLVIDMSNLHKNVALSEQVKRVGFVLRLEIFFDSGCLRFLFKILDYKKMKIYGKIKVDNSDRKVLSDAEKQNLDFILAKRVKRPNVLKRLRNYISNKVNERNCDGVKNTKKEIIEKLDVIEEIIKNLHEVHELRKHN